MADQVEVPKVNLHPLIGPTAIVAAVPKLVMFVLLTPTSSEEGDTSNRQGHVHTQLIRR